MCCPSPIINFFSKLLNLLDKVCLMLDALDSLLL